MASSAGGKTDSHPPNFTLGGGAHAEGLYDFEGDGLVDSDDALTAEFRHRLGLLPDEEEGLTEAFKQRIGLASDGECSRDVSEVTMPEDIEREETITKFRFSNFAKTRFQPEIGACSFYKDPLKGPLLVATAKKTDIERVASAAISLAIKRFCKDVNVPDVTPSVYAVRDKYAKFYDFTRTTVCT